MSKPSSGWEFLCIFCNNTQIKSFDWNGALMMLKEKKNQAYYRGWENSPSAKVIAQFVILDSALP